MYLLDSNILIYSAKTEYAFLRNYIMDENINAYVSTITIIEVLGFNRLTERDKKYFEACEKLLEVLDVNRAVTKAAVKLRQEKKISLGDAIIAATAIVHNLVLVTRNVADFEHIEHLRIINPIA